MITFVVIKFIFPVFQGSTVVFRNVFCKAPDEKTKKYLPGKIDYELRFNKLSALEVVEPSTEPVQKLNHLADHLGYQQSKRMLSAANLFTAYKS